jgi:hypothetical protein
MSSIRAKPSGVSASTRCITCSGQFSRLASTIFAVVERRSPS